jgi:hypothetical protein
MGRIISCGACFAVVLALSACGGGDPDSAAPGSGTRTASGPQPSGNGACALLMQNEVDGLFGASVGAGVDEVLDGGVQICSWPAGDEPSLLLQISGVSPNIRAAVDLGDGFRVVEITDMAGAAAAAIEQSDGPEAVVVVALTTDDKTVTVSPVGLGITEDSPKFQTIKTLTSSISSRLSDPETR